MVSYRYHNLTYGCLNIQRNGVPVNVIFNNNIICDPCIHGKFHMVYNAVIQDTPQHDLFTKMSTYYSVFTLEQIWIIL